MDHLFFRNGAPAWVIIADLVNWPFLLFILSGGKLPRFYLRVD